MPTARYAIAAIAALLLATGATRAADPVTLRAPGGKITVALTSADGRPSYRVTFGEKTLISDSPLGITFKDSGPLGPLEVKDVRHSSHDLTYALPFGKSATARDHYNQTTLVLSERDANAPRRIELTFRAYDDGVAFRYHFPEQPHLKEFSITSEDSTFSLPKDATAWVLPLPHPGGHYEYLYQPTQVSALKPDSLAGPPLLVQLPGNGPALAITEANLTDYAGMALSPSPGSPHVLRTSLTPLPNQKEVKVKAKPPHSSPWRVIQIGDHPGRLIESNLVSNLSDPCAIEDTSWIKPGKIAFLWWNGYLVGHNGRRGAVDTATVKHYVDGAAELGFPYSSIDGLDIAWYGGKIPGYGEHDITVPVKQLDMPAVLAHAKRKGVRIRLWVASQGMRKYLDKALATYEKWGVEGVMVDFIERDDQETVNWIRELVEKAAKHRLTVTLHNVPKPTGLSRTYPNLLNYEAIRNQEWNKWDPIGVPPDHNLTVPFTRMLAGPLDYHSGGFRNIRTADYLPRDVAPDVMGTRAHQLAMYVVYENPMPMAVDYPAAYRKRPGIDLLASLPTTWDETRFIAGQVGDFITLARRKGDTWYVASMTDDTPRTLQIPLTFLPDGDFTADLWSDDPKRGPSALTHSTQAVTRTTTASATLDSAGGQVIRIRAVAAK